MPALSPNEQSTLRPRGRSVLLALRWLPWAALAVACYEGRSLDLFPTSSGANPLACSAATGCPPERSFCVLGSCVECTSNTDCDGRNKRACASGVCVTCVDDEQCAAGQACNRGADRCVPRCTSPAECVGTPEARCNTELGYCVECAASADCQAPDKRACDSRSGRCVACNQDVDCDVMAPACDTLRQVCVECTENEHCDGLTCDPERRRCVECSQQEQCPPGARCDVMAGRCISNCGADAECDPKHPHCLVAEGRCAECIDNTDCQEPQRPACDATGRCVGCLVDANCTEPGKPACVTARFQCAQCTRDEHCMGGMRCDLRRAACMP
jgi:hypothetical protein